MDTRFGISLAASKAKQIVIWKPSSLVAQVAAGGGAECSGGSGLGIR